MQHVSSLGGPRVLLPSIDVARWIRELGDSPTVDAGLYGQACSVGGYCGVIFPWRTPLLVFGDSPADIYYCPDLDDGLLFRWEGADSLDELTAFAIAEAESESWDETMKFDSVGGDMTLMDTCTFVDDSAPRIQLAMRAGSYRIKSRYAENSRVSTVLHRLEYIG